MSWWCLGQPASDRQRRWDTWPPAAWEMTAAPARACCRSCWTLPTELIRPSRCSPRYATPVTSPPVGRKQLLLAGCRLLPGGTVPPTGLSWCRCRGHSSRGLPACRADVQCSPAERQTDCSHLTRSKKGFDKNRSLPLHKDKTSAVSVNWRTKQRTYCYAITVGSES